MTAAEILERLLRFDTTNPPGRERECVAFVDGLLQAAGIPTVLLGREPERPNLVARLPGRGEAPPLLLQGHVDVVTTAHQAWTHPPFAGVIADGCLWGRGALDMKGGVAMMLAAVLAAQASGSRPAGDVLLAVLADEENGGEAGAKFLVEEHAERFAGVRYALGEFGGFTQHLAGRRFYPIQVAEKQACRIRATLRGPGGHGALGVANGALARLGRLLTRLDGARLPAHLTPVARLRLEAMARALPFPSSFVYRRLADPAWTDRVLGWLGARARGFVPWLCNTATPTVVRGGEKVNVVPSEVTLELDGRVLPGFAPADLVAELAAVAGPEVELEVVAREAGGFEAGRAEVDLGLFDTLAGVLAEADPGAVPVPMLLPAVTDGRFFARLGIQTYGFTPMKLPPGLDFITTIHAADERIPLEALEFGTKTIAEVLRRYGRPA